MQLHCDLLLKVVISVSDTILRIIEILATALASSGLWAYMISRKEKKDVKTEMLIGLGHDRIVGLGMNYLKRGWITQDEYENLHDYLYVPYKKMGGNGSAERIMKEVDKLPIAGTNVNN